ncbi:PH domain-containing protein [Paractinoplanes ferrugineus]|uniref:Membrane protein n=1 Tax=Paractinoplanes ferrugineus TaxID=113564 RepID=A0A919JDM9_9ACTN|nr:PH domain-containing protein [Actinoplanes ferrugineus]GIE15246.1 membrane protein [Actinoplanes ferrugineus]
MTADVVRLRPPMHRVNPRARWYWAARAAVLWIVLLVPQVIWWVADSGEAELPHVLVGVAWAVLAAVHLIVMPQWRYRVHRWEATDTAVYTQTGWLSQERRIAPISRVQTVDSERGPIEQLFKLANVTVTTASAAGPLKIDGLAAKDAEQLVADLTTRVGHTLGDAT